MRSVLVMCLASVKLLHCDMLAQAHVLQKCLWATVRAVLLWHVMYGHCGWEETATFQSPHLQPVLMLCVASNANVL